MLTKMTWRASSFASAEGLKTVNRQSVGEMPLLGDVKILLLLFISFRLAMLMSFQPLPTSDGESGIGTGGDRLYHFKLAALVEDGYLPFRDWWSEFPPIWYALSTAAYLLLGDGVNYTNWSVVLGLVLLAFEVGNLLMVRAIGADIYDQPTGITLAWIYGFAVAPAIFMWWNFDAMMNFFFLAGIYMMVRRQESRSAILIAIGFLVKFLPALLLAAVFRFRATKPSIRYVLISVVVGSLVYLPLFALNSEMTLISLRAQFEKPSHQTVWALLDGNFATGNFGDMENRFSSATIYEGSNRHRESIPKWLRIAVAAAIGVLVFVRTERLDERGLIAFAGVTLLVFYLQAQAWSPQWVTLIIPLTLLVFPNRRGVMTTIVLSLLALAEYPVLWSRTGDLEPPGIMGGDLLLPWGLVVMMRTIILVALALAFYRKLRIELPRSGNEP